MRLDVSVTFAPLFITLYVCPSFLQVGDLGGAKRLINDKAVEAPIYTPLCCAPEQLRRAAAEDFQCAAPGFLNTPLEPIVGSFTHGMSSMHQYVMHMRGRMMMGARIYVRQGMMYA